ncbi:MAG: right-handed parallel beta-helix repeat-containing protein [Spirochaetaceae bacterium]|jgi:hypothetical protein|nr:right-handed parallel beta-helix repeat-containing protein [Spirochaetaceae bacterium]
MHVKLKRVKKIVFSGLALVVLAAAAFASCEVIAAGSGVNQNSETVWIRLVPDKAANGKAKLGLDFSKAIPGLTNDTPTADLRALFTFTNGGGCPTAEYITALSITKDSEAVYTLTVQNVPDNGQGIVLVTITTPGVAPPTRAWSLDGEPEPLWSHNKEPLAELPEYYASNYGAGLRDGSNWDNAVNNKKLYDVLVKAADRGSAVKVYVAAGTYIPWNTHSDDAPTGHAASFTLASNVAVYGGFANGLSGTVSATDQSARAGRFNTDGSGAGYGTIKPEFAATYETILSGDLNGDDNGIDVTTATDFTVMDNNAYHVVTIPEGTNSTAKLDGFTIKCGNAASETFETEEDVMGMLGGGILSCNSLNGTPPSPVLTNLTITGNQGSGGGGMYNYRSAPAITNVTIVGNRGCGMFNVQSSPILTNVLIAGNQGSGIVNRASSSLILTNVDIIDNQTTAKGGGIYNDGCKLVLTNVTIAGNTAEDHGGGIYNFYYDTLVLTNVLIAGNQAGDKGGGIYNNAHDKLVLTNVTIAGNKAGASGGGMCNENLWESDIRNSIVWGNTASSGANVYNDITYPGTSTWTNSLVEGSGGWDTVNWGTNTAASIAVSDSPFEGWIDPSTGGWAPTSAANYQLSGAAGVNVGSNSLYDGQSAPSTWTDAVIAIHGAWTNFLSALKDLDGAPRKKGIIDMGAYERQ